MNKSLLLIFALLAHTNFVSAWAKPCLQELSSAQTTAVSTDKSTPPCHQAQQEIVATKEHCEQQCFCEMISQSPTLFTNTVISNSLVSVKNSTYLLYSETINFSNNTPPIRPPKYYS